MATKLWEQEIDKTVDWGGDNSTGGAPVSGQYVQKFLKDTLAKKFGYLHFDRAALKYYVFADEYDYNKYANDTTGEYANLLLATFDAPAPATISIEETSSQRITILSTEKNQSISFKYIVKDSGNNPITESIKASFVFNNSGTIQTVTQNYDVDFDNYQTGVTQTFNIDNYLTVGTNNITVTLTGVSTQATTTLSFVYTVVELLLSSEFDNKVAVEFDESKGTIDNYFAVPYTIQGQGEKIMEWFINGKELKQDWVNAINPDLQALSSGYVASRNANYSSNMIIYLTNELGELQNGLKQGKNTLQFRMCVTDTNGNKIYSITKYYDFVVISKQNVSEITAILYSQDLGSGSMFSPEDVVSFNTQQYSSTSFKYGLFSTSGSAVNLNFNLSKTEEENTTQIASLTRSIMSGEEQTFEYSFLTFGNIDLVITTASTDESGNPLDSLHIIVNVAKSSVQIAVNEESLLLNLEALNRSNSEPNPAVWKYKTIETSFNKVLWNSTSGWDGKSLVLNNGATAFIPLNVFDNFSSSGLTIELDFETVNVQDEEAVIFSFEDANNPSAIKVTACGAYMSDRNGNSLTTNFDDNTRIKLAFIYNPFNKNFSESTADYPNTMFFIVNGILDRSYSFGGDLKWINPTTTGMTLGNVDSKAGVKFHSVRVYNKALNLNEELTNFIAESDDLLDVFNKNNVYASGTETVSLDILKNVCPTLVVYGDKEDFDKSKSKKENWEWDVELYDPFNPELDFFARGAWFSNQGTSSLKYPKRNLRMYFGKTKDDKTQDDSAQYYTEVYLAGEFTHGQTNDPSLLGNFFCNKKTCKNGYHKLYNHTQASKLEKEGTQLFYKAESGDMYPCSFGDGSVTEKGNYYIALYRPVKTWKMVKELRYSGVTLYKVSGYSTVVNPITEVEYQVPVFEKLKGKKKLSEDTQYYIDQAQWKQSPISGWTNRWTVKTDYAESSMTHNAGVGRLWGNAMKNVVTSDGYICRTKAQQVMGGYADGIDIRTSCDGKPVVGFNAPLDRDAEKNVQYDDNGFRKYKPAEFMGLFNIMTDKGSTPLFGFEDIYDENGTKIFDASKVECWEASNNSSLFGQGVNLITDNDYSNTFMGTRYVFSDYEPRWPDVELEYNDDEYLVAHTHNLESLWRFVNFCKPAVDYIVDGRDGYTLSSYIEIPESEYESIVASGSKVYIEIDDSGNIKYEELDYKGDIDTIYNNAPVFRFVPDIDYDNVSKTLSNKKIEGHVYKAKVASFDAKHGTYVEDIAFDDAHVDTGRVNYGDKIAGSEFEEDYYVNVYLISKGSSKYDYINEYGEQVQFAGSVDKDVYEVDKNGESFAGKTYMDYFSAKKYDYFNVERLAAYYIYLMRFCAVDQVVKNSMLTTEDGQHYYYINYDNDTVLGVRNDGNIVYHWNTDRNTYDKGAGQYAFAGPKSVLWNLLELDNDFMTVVKRIDNAMYTSKVLSAKIALDMFNNKQAGTWSERLYNEQEKIKYLSQWDGSDETYLKFIHGSRTQHRTWFIKNRFNLYDSKWYSGEYASNKIKFYLGVQASVNQPAELFSIEAASQNVFALINSDLDEVPTDWGKELKLGESHTWSTVSSWNGISSPFSLMGIDKIKTLDFTTGVGKHSFGNIIFDEDGTGWTKNKGVMITRLLYGISDEFRKSITLRFTNVSGNPVVIEGVTVNPGEYYDTTNDISTPAGCTVETLGITRCGVFGFGGLNTLTSLEEIDIRNVFNDEPKNHLNDLNISDLVNLHIYRAIGSSITSFNPAEGVVLNEVSLPNATSFGHRGIQTITLKNVTFTPAENQEAPVFKYTPDYALRNISFNNVTGIDIVQFITNWDTDLTNKAIEHKLCSVNLENINIKAPVEFILETIKKFNLNNFTGKVQLIGDGENGSLTEKEYNDIIEVYGANVFNPSSSLVFSCSEGMFWTSANLTKKDGDSSINELAGASYYFDGIIGNKYTLSATIFPINTDNKIIYKAGYWNGKKYIDVSPEGNSVTLFNNSLKILSNTNTGVCTIQQDKFISDLNQEDRWIRIYATVDKKFVGDYIYLKLNKAVVPSSISVVPVEEDLVTSETDKFILTKNAYAHKFLVKFEGDFNVPVKSVAITTNNNALSTDSMSINPLGFNDDNQYEFEITPFIKPDTTENDLNIKISFDTNFPDLQIKEIKKKVKIVTIIPTSFILVNYKGLISDNHIEINEPGTFEFFVKLLNNGEDIVNVPLKSVTINTSSVYPTTHVEIDEDDKTKIIITVDPTNKSYDEEFNLTVTCNFDESFNISNLEDVVYSVNSSIITPNAFKLSHFVVPDNYQTETIYDEIRLANGASFDKTLKIIPINTGFITEDVTVDCTISDVETSWKDESNVEDIKITKDSSSLRIEVTAHNANPDKHILIVKCNINGVEYTKELVISRTLAAYTSWRDIKDLNKVYFVDDSNNIYDIWNNDGTENTALIAAIQDNNILPEIIGVMMISTSPVNDNAATAKNYYSCIPLLMTDNDNNANYRLLADVTGITSNSTNPLFYEIGKHLRDMFIENTDSNNGSVLPYYIEMLGNGFTTVYTGAPILGEWLTNALVNNDWTDTILINESGYTTQDKYGEKGYYYIEDNHDELVQQHYAFVSAYYYLQKINNKVIGGSDKVRNTHCSIGSVAQYSLILNNVDNLKTAIEALLGSATVQQYQFWTDYIETQKTIKESYYLTSTVSGTLGSVPTNDRLPKKLKASGGEETTSALSFIESGKIIPFIQVK